jgi:Sec-independent protein translocase protein TatA
MGSDILIVLIVILVLVVIWRGPKTLPRLGEALGRGVKEAKTEAKIAQSEIQARASGEDTSTPETGPDRPA